LKLNTRCDAVADVLDEGTVKEFLSVAATYCMLRRPALPAAHQNIMAWRSIALTVAGEQE
jgi:hypothetical protein